MSSFFTSGNIEAAAARIQPLLAQTPNDPQAIHLAGLIYVQQQQFEEARRFLQRAALLLPADAFVQNNLAMTLRELGETDAAIDAAQRAIAIDPQLPDAHNNLANALKDKGIPDQALIHYRRAAMLATGNLLFQQNLAMALLVAGDLDGAESTWREMLRRSPDMGLALSGLGEVAAARQQWPESRQWLMRALDAGFRDVRVHNALGRVHQELKEYRQAFEQFKQALTINPDQPEIWYNLGYVLAYNENHVAALKAFQEAFKRGLRTVDVKILLLDALVSEGKIDEAHAVALELLPEAEREPALLPPLLNTFSSVCDFSRNEEVWRLFDDAITHDRIEPHSIDRCLMLSCYSDSLPEARILSYHGAWARHVEAVITALPASSGLPSVSAPRLRIGYLSSDFRRHSVGFFVQHVLAHHDRDSVEVFCYSNSRERDVVTEHIERYVDHFIDVRDLDDLELAKRIRADGINILVDLAGHTEGHRLGVFPYRPAPVSLTWIGYLHTTGLQSMDYRISDPFVDAATGESGPERLLRLPESFLCIGGLPEVDMGNQPPCVNKGHVTFASFNNLQKLNRSVIRLWARILAAVPDSRLVIMANRVKEAQVAIRHIRAEFSRHAIDPGRIEFLGSLGRVDYLRFHNEVDVVLDSFPFNGGTVTVSALWMGVPVVTLVGPAHRQRVSYSMLRNIGVEETIAWNEDEYVAKAVSLVQDPPALAALRQRIAGNIRGSILCDPARFTRQFEAALRHAWDDYCSNNG